MTSKPGAWHYVAFASELSTPEPAYVTNDDELLPKLTPAPSIQARNN